METQEQRKLGYGGDDGGMSGGGGGDDGDDGDDGDYDDGWNPGDEGEPSTMGLGILLVIGAWALWEYKRPGGSLNPQRKSTSNERGTRRRSRTSMVSPGRGTREESRGSSTTRS